MPSSSRKLNGDYRKLSVNKRCAKNSRSVRKNNELVFQRKIIPRGSLFALQATITITGNLSELFTRVATVLFSALKAPPLSLSNRYTDYYRAAFFQVFIRFIKRPTISFP